MRNEGFQMLHEIHITPKTISDSRRAYLQFFRGIGEKLLNKNANHEKFDLSHLNFHHKHFKDLNFLSIEYLSFNTYNKQTQKMK